MKKIFVLCCLCAALSIPAIAQAASTTTVYEEQTVYATTTRSPQKEGIGIYVTPKIIWGYGVMDKIKGEAHVQSGGVDAGASKKAAKTTTHGAARSQSAMIFIASSTPRFAAKSNTHFSATWMVPFHAAIPTMPQVSRVAPS